MAITDQNLMNEMQYHLLETANNGASYGSGLYTVAEVVGRLNFRLDLFNALTGVMTTCNASQNATSDNKFQSIDTAALNIIDILSLFYSSDTDGGTATYYAIPRGSSFEADKYITTQAPVAIPYLYSIDTAEALQVNMFPAPTFVGTNRKLKLHYIHKLSTMPATPNGTTILLQDDFTPFVKYGVLADLFNKSGEAYDPARADICESLFQLGVEVAKGWVSGTMNE